MLEANKLFCQLSPAALSALLAEFIAATEAARAAKAAALGAVAAKKGKFKALKAALKQELRYAELVAEGDDAKLKLLGWGGRAAATEASALTPPGQPLSLKAPEQGEDWLTLFWKAPPDGGAVAAYKVERRLRPDGAWLTAALSLDCKATLSAQERGREWEYRVVAVNKAGESAPSNTVTAVL